MVRRAASRGREGPCYVLGADFSTDSLKWVVGDARSGEIVETGSVKFLDAFGDSYGLKEGGFLRMNGGIVRVPLGLVADAIEWMFTDLKQKLGDNWNHLRRICISAQQHGMAGFKLGTDTVFKSMVTNHERPLSFWMSHLFVGDGFTSWMDESPKDVDAPHLEHAMPPDVWGRLTGSSPMQSLRFLLPQAAWLARKRRSDYLAVDQFGVFASHIAAILVGRRVGMGRDEASCTLLMDIATGQWAQNQLEAVVPAKLFQKLPEIIPPGADLGRISAYFVRRFGVPTTCKVTLGFGDNPAAFLTMGEAPGLMGLSLGSSGTTYALLEEATFDPWHKSHVLRTATDGFMAMYCTSLCGKFVDAVREGANLDWDSFLHQVASSTMSDPSVLVFPREGATRYISCGSKSTAVAVGSVRAVLANMLVHSSFISWPKMIIATGGLAKPAVCQVIADMFGVSVRISPEMERVALGGVIQAAAQETEQSVMKIAAMFCPAGTPIQPNRDNVEFYKKVCAEFVRETSQAS